MSKHSLTLAARVLRLATLFGVVTPVAARAQDVLGGHFGVVLPLVTRSAGQTTTVGDQFKIGFPMGINIKTSDNVSFDLSASGGAEFV